MRQLLNTLTLSVIGLAAVSTHSAIDQLTKAESFRTYELVKTNPRL